MTPNPRHPSGTAAVLIASLVWGSSFVLGKRVLDELSVYHLVLFRFLIAAAAFAPVLLLGRRRPARRDHALFALTGFLMVPLTFLLQFGGLALTSATSTALLIGAGAPLLALGGALFDGERVAGRLWLAIAISTAGVALLAGMPGPEDDWRGNLLVLASVVIATVWVLLSRRLALRYPSAVATGWILVWGTLFLVPVALVGGGLPPLALSAGAWASLAALGLACTVGAYVLWNWGIARIGAARAGVWLNFEPAAGAALGILLLGEPVTLGTASGGLLILLGAGLLTAPEKPPAPLAEPAALPVHGAKSGSHPA